MKTVMHLRALKEMVNNNQKVRFQFYRDQTLWYATECGFEFPVPLSDTGTATFLGEERAILLMRYIRKHRSYIVESMAAEGVRVCGGGEGAGA